MNTGHLFASSVVRWFANQPDDIIDAIANVSDIPHDQIFRMSEVYDPTLRDTVPTAAQRLIRWSVVEPEEVFKEGFPPAVFPGDDTFPYDAFDLRVYVEHNSESIFVSTTRPYRKANIELALWEPRITPANQRRFRYDIFAYGGIDVNDVLGPHTHWNQHEIAFPGEIRPEMVRLAREYDDTQIVQIWMNRNFDTNVNPPGHVPSTAVIASSSQPRCTSVRYYPATDSEGQSSERAVTISE